MADKETLENRFGGIFQPGDRLFSTGVVCRILGPEWYPRRVIRIGPKLGISRRPYPGGHWRHSLPAFRMLAAGDDEALEKFRQGDRESPQVRRYLGTLLTGRTV